MQDSPGTEIVSRLLCRWSRVHSRLAGVFMPARCCFFCPSLRILPALNLVVEAFQALSDICSPGALAHVRWEGFWSNHLVGRRCDCVFNRIAQLADVPRPIVERANLDRLPCNADFFLG